MKRNREYHANILWFFIVNYAFFIFHEAFDWTIIFDVLQELAILFPHDSKQSIIPVNHFRKVKSSNQNTHIRTSTNNRFRRFWKLSTCKFNVFTIEICEVLPLHVNIGCFLSTRVWKTKHDLDGILGAESAIPMLSNIWFSSSRRTQYKVDEEDGVFDRNLLIELLGRSLVPIEDNHLF